MSQFLNYFKKPSAKPPPQPVYSVAEPPKDTKEVGIQKLDFEAFGLPEYKDKYALVLDNVFSPEDCRKLYSVTGGSLEDYSGNWEAAQINAGGDKQYLDTSYRNSGRILVDTFDMAEWIHEKIYPYLTEIHQLDNASRHFVPMKEEATARARLYGLNERLRFLKYEPGSFFKKHCDGLYSTPDESLEGGSTRIFSHKDDWPESDDSWPDSDDALSDSDVNAGNILIGPCVDIPARLGRVLIFEQEDLLHSGEPVQKGIKISMRTDFMYEVVHITDDDKQVSAGTRC